MSNSNRNYSNLDNNNGHYDAQPSSSSYRQQQHDHPLQNQQPGQEFELEDQLGGRQQTSSGRQKRTLNPARAVVSGVTQGAQAVKGGISNVEKGVTTVGSHLTKVPGVSHGVTFFSDYRKFMDRGNVVDLAVAVVIGAAFTAIVTSLVTDIITPVIALASGKNLEENFLILRYSHNETAQAMGLPATRQQAKNAGDITWNWGNFLQTVINFFIISGCVFLIVKIYQVGRNKKIEVTEKKCDYCLKSVPLNAVRCPNCTTWLDWDACARVKDMELAAAGSKTESPFVDPSYNRDYQAGHASLGRF
ncbi:hypothetical protein BGZ58_010490 [Dissophora ornata]|nr:hypothetical protein BGZ58_010490 [Dissophora ornata]